MKNNKVKNIRTIEEFTDLAREAHGWEPKGILAGSNQIKEWRCSKGHLWSAKISHRVNGSGCPYCSNQKLLTGFNDLATTNPELAAEAFGWDPTKTISAAGKKLDWICKFGHRYQSRIPDRKIGGGCPYCSGRKVLKGFNDLKTLLPELAKEAHGWDPSEVTIGVNRNLSWICEQGHIYKAKPAKRRKGSSCPYCSRKTPLAGFNDLATTHPDLAAQAFGWDPRQVLSGSDKKLNWKCSQDHVWKMRIADRAAGDGCPFCSGHKVLAGFNDLTTTHPTLAEEAHGWDPSLVNSGSNKNREWVCSKGHIWTAQVANRALRNDKCVYCSGKKVLAGFNDLATTHPQISSEAHGWDPTKISGGSGIKKTWICSFGHKWSASPVSRTHMKSGCPSCAKSGFDPNLDGWLYFLKHEDWEMLQIGITNYPDKRLATHNRLGWELLEIRGPQDGWLTQKWETDILRMLKKKGARLSPEEIAGKFDGYSEAWIERTYPAKSIKELIAQADIFAESRNKH